MNVYDVCEILKLLEHFCSSKNILEAILDGFDSFEVLVLMRIDKLSAL